MLQPLQLQEVSLRYVQGIAEVRDLLSKAGIAVGTPGALGDTVARLSADTAFHRDFTSQVWVLVHTSDRQISYADLLGIVVVAAAGIERGAAADPDQAHDLLRFVMEARGSLDPVPERSRPAPGGPIVRSPVELTDLPDPARDDVPVASPKREWVRLPRPEPPRRTGDARKRGVVICVALLLVALPVGMWLHQHTAASRTHAGGPDDSFSIRVGNAGSSGETAGSLPGVALGDSPGLTPLHAPETSTNSRNPLRSTRGSQQRSDVTPTEAQSLTAGMNRRPAPPGISAARISAAPIVRTSPVPATPAPIQRIAQTAGQPHSGQQERIVPVEVLSQRLGARMLPAYAGAPADGNLESSKYPQLRRRSGSAGDGQSSNGATLLAEVQQPGKPIPSSSGKSAALSPVSGIVRPTALGIMAGNVLYSPSPAYPAAASAAHVQGEVRVQADVDRDGNVSYARVVSGPPLLRNAALNAVQHWRYRPFLASGKPVPMTTSAVVDFELP